MLFPGRGLEIRDCSSSEKPPAKTRIFREDRLSVVPVQFSMTSSPPLVSSGTGVFITSILKCRPPENRIPRKDEIAACAGYLDRQIDHLSPEIIIPMGRLASEQVFSRFGIPHGPIGSIHGKIFHSVTSRGKVVIIPVYHPAAMTHNPLLKGALFEDFKVIGTMLGTKTERWQVYPGTG